MPRRPDLPCADCGTLMWRGTTSLPEGQARCRPCRRARPGDKRIGPTNKRFAVCSKCGEQMEVKPERNPTGTPTCSKCRRATKAERLSERANCLTCGDEFAVWLDRGRKGLDGPRVTCSPACGRKRNGMLTKKECTTPTPRTAWSKVCPWCDVPFDTTSKAQVYCGKVCVRRARESRRVKAVVPRWVAGTCRLCGASFVDVWLADQSSLYCSRECSTRVARDRRRARKRNAYVADVSRAYIYTRDNWTCHLCGKKVAKTKVVPHPKAPVLDHVIPLAVGGTHEPKNVALAHFMCNSIKGARAVGEQLALIG